MAHVPFTKNKYSIAIFSKELATSIVVQGLSLLCSAFFSLVILGDKLAQDTVAADTLL